MPAAVKELNKDVTRALLESDPNPLGVVDQEGSEPTGNLVGKSTKVLEEKYRVVVELGECFSEEDAEKLIDHFEGALFKLSANDPPKMFIRSMFKIERV